VFSPSYYRRCCCCCCSSNNNNNYYYYIQIHHSYFQTQKYITHNTSTSLPQAVAHRNVDKTQRDSREEERERTRARVWRVDGGDQPKEQTEEPKPSSHILRVLTPGGGPAGAFRPGYHHSGCPLRLGTPYSPVLYFWYPIQLTTAWFLHFQKSNNLRGWVTQLSSK
jgi:hypothetical protein